VEIVAREVGETTIGDDGGGARKRRIAGADVSRQVPRQVRTRSNCTINKSCK